MPLPLAAIRKLPTTVQPSDEPVHESVFRSYHIVAWLKETVHEAVRRDQESLDACFLSEVLHLLTEPNQEAARLQEAEDLLTVIHGLLHPLEHPNEHDTLPDTRTRVKEVRGKIVAFKNSVQS